MKYVICMFIVLFLDSQSLSQTLTITDTGNNVSSKDIIQFRARNGFPGHAFVLFGKEYDNGLKVFDAAGGFYPEDGSNNIITIKNIINGPGEINYKLDDMDNDVTFTVNVTPDQVTRAKEKLNSWDTKKYAFAWRNCVDLSRTVAAEIGLEIPDRTIDITKLPVEYPPNFVTKLSELNEANTPIEVDRAAKSAEESRKKDKEREAERIRKENEEEFIRRSLNIRLLQEQQARAAAQAQAEAVARAQANARAIMEATERSLREAAERAAREAAERAAREAAARAAREAAERAAREAAERVAREAAERAAREAAARAAEEAQRRYGSFGGGGGGSGGQIPPPFLP